MTTIAGIPNQYGFSGDGGQATNAKLYSPTGLYFDELSGSLYIADDCTCGQGWIQVDCSITHCFGFTSNLPDRVCSGRGKCVKPDECHCNPDAEDTSANDPGLNL